MAQTQIRQSQLSGGLDGWIPFTETCTYSSADDPTYVMTVPGDLTSKYTVGMKVKIVQGASIKYFIITATADIADDTHITMYGGTDYDLANATINEAYFSMVKAPQGFPMSPAKWSISYNIASSGGSNYLSGATVAQFGSLQLDVPIGIWDIYARFQAYLSTTSPSYDYLSIIGNVAISTSTSSFSNTNLQGYIRRDGNTSSSVGDTRPVLATPVFMRDLLDISSKTTYYIVGNTGGDNAANVRLWVNLGDGANGYIRATCAYL